MSIYPRKFAPGRKLLFRSREQKRKLQTAFCQQEEARSVLHVHECTLGGVSKGRSQFLNPLSASPFACVNTFAVCFFRAPAPKSIAQIETQGLDLFAESVQVRALANWLGSSAGENCKRVATNSARTRSQFKIIQRPSDKCSFFFSVGNNLRIFQISLIPPGDPLVLCASRRLKDLRFLMSKPQTRSADRSQN